MGLQHEDENLRVIPGLMKDSWTATSSDATTAVAAVAVVAGRTHFVSVIGGYTSVAGRSVQLKDGVTVKWQLLSAVGPFHHIFRPPLEMTVSQTPSLTLTGSENGTVANMAGFVL